MDRKLWTETCAIAARHAPGEPEDLAQDLAVRVLEQAAAPRNPAAWIERVGRNAAIDRWRGEARRRELLREVELSDGGGDPESLLLGHERRVLVRRAIAALPRPQRRAALARFHADLSYDDAADRLGTPAATARTRVHRALAVLRARLSALRAMFVLPGVQTATLGLALVAAQSSPARLPRVLAVDDAAPSPTRENHHAVPARVMAAAAPATAAPTRAPAPKPARSVPPEPVQTLTFGEDQVEGTLSRPDELFVSVPPRIEHSSLIELRRQFIPELLKTLEDL